MPLKLEVVKGDITQTDTDAIVNAANNEFWMGAGVAGAIKAAGGQVIEDEAVNKGPVMPGEAIYTCAGKLRFMYIIHAAVMGQDLRTTDKYIRQATIASLNIAEKLKLKSIARFRNRRGWFSPQGVRLHHDHGGQQFHTASQPPGSRTVLPV